MSFEKQIEKLKDIRYSTPDEAPVSVTMVMDMIIELAKMVQESTNAINETTCEHGNHLAEVIAEGNSNVLGAISKEGEAVIESLSAVISE